MSKKNRVITPEHLQRLQEGRRAWLDSLSDEQKAALAEKAAKSREIGRLKAELKKLKMKKVKAKTPPPGEKHAMDEMVNADPVGLPVVGVREEVRSFSMHMEKKLRKRDGYGGWRNLPLQYLKEKMKGELTELLLALDYENSNEVMDECVDVANYAMFLWDIMRTSDPRDRQAIVDRTKDQGRS